MMDWLTSVIVGLNVVANAFGRLLEPIGLLPGWLSATMVAVATGVAMLLMFKYTSNQAAIKQVRRGIRANLLSVRLFRDNFRLGFRAQGRVLLGAIQLLLLAVVPILVMTVPMVLLLAQLGLWYQMAPLAVDQEAIVSVKLSGEPGDPMPTVTLNPSPAIKELKRTQVPSKREVWWSIRPLQPGYHILQFDVAGQTVEKELSAGDGVMRVSPLRPARDWSDVLLYPREQPFDRDSVVQSIAIDYPTRSSWTSGTDYWVIYWFVVSLLTGFCLRGVFNVNI